MKTTKYLDFYKQCMKTGYMPHASGLNDSNGLCTMLGDSVAVFAPTLEEKNELRSEGESHIYWGYDVPLSKGNHYDMNSKFTPRRQTIVLFLAAINGEL